MSTFLCPHCGQQHRQGARFCSVTGKPIASTAATPADASSPPAQTASEARTPWSGPQAAMPRPVSPEGVAGLTGRLPANFMLQDRYLIVRKVGQGGMAAVYQAIDTWQPGTPWAIKEMSDAALKDHDRKYAVEAFLNEARLLRTLSHPNLPQVVDAFTDGGKHYLVMEFISGRTLLDLLQQRAAPFSEAEVLPWALQLCDVLHYLHSQEPKIIFRDIKPSNIMLTQEGRIKLIDFGIARFFKPGKSSDTMALGTPGYAAPEAVGGQTDERSDIYSLCITLHQLLTMFDPMREMFNLPLLRSLNPAVSMQMERIVMRGLHNQRDGRWQNAQELKTELSLLERIAFRQPAPVVQTGGRARPVSSPAKAPASAGQPAAPVAPTERAAYPATSTPSASPGLAGTAARAPETSRPTTRLLAYASEVSGKQLAAIGTAAMLLLVIATVVLAPWLDDLDFNWNNVPFVALFGAFGYAAYPKRGVAFLTHTLFAIVFVSTVWLTVGTQGYEWINLLVGALLSGAFMELWVWFLPRVKRTGRSEADHWQRELLWLSVMAAVGATLFYWIVSAGNIGFGPVPFLISAGLGAAGWFLGDLLKQSMERKHAIATRSGFK